VRFAPRLHLLDDRGDLALRSLDRGRAAWLGRRYGLLDFFVTLERVEVRLYLGDLDEALALLTSGLRAARRALMLTVHFHRVIVADLRGRVLLAHAARRRGGDALKDARACAAELEGDTSTLAHAFGASLRAGCLSAGGDAPGARRAYARARDAFAALGVEHRAAAAATAAGDPDGVTTLRTLGFVNPPALVASLCPAARVG
jgi:hypothetical protein